MGLVRVKLKSDGSVRVIDANAAYTLIQLKAATYIEGTLPTEIPVETHAFAGCRRLVAIITCHGAKFMEQADVQRRTWVPQVEKFGFDVRFFLGKSERPPRADEVYLDVDDGYAGLPAKVRAMFGWSVAQGYDYTLKTDDDVYIVAHRLDKAPVAPHDFVGRFRPPSGGYPAEYASGFAYWLSKKAAGHVANAPLNGDWAEDRYVANVLAIEGVYGMMDGESYVAPSPPLSVDVIARSGVSGATVLCQFNAKELQRMHNLFSAKVNMPLMPYTLKPAPQYRCTLPHLMRAPMDKIPNRPEGSNVG